MSVSIRAMEPGDDATVRAAASLFDHEPQDAWTEAFLADPGHHLLIAFVDDQPAGFVTGVVVRHPDKGPEMLLYELGVAEDHRQKGIGTALVMSLRDRSQSLGHRGMWVIIDADDEIPAATYRAAGATVRERAELLSWDFA